MTSNQHYPTDPSEIRERDAFYDGAHVMDPLREEPAIERLPVEPRSTNLERVGWAAFPHPAYDCNLTAHEIPCGILEVEFTSGEVFRYYHTSTDVAELMQGRRGRPLASVGAYFHTAIRRNTETIPFRRVAALS